MVDGDDGRNLTLSLEDGSRSPVFWVSGQHIEGLGDQYGRAGVILLAMGSFVSTLRSQPGDWGVGDVGIRVNISATRKTRKETEKQKQTN